MLSKIQIANRGEIACRNMETAQRMGVATVDSDVGALHVMSVDVAERIGATLNVEIEETRFGVFRM